MSKEFTCDNCGKKKDDSGLVSAKGWMQITISGNVPRTDKRYGGHQSVKYDMCDECLIKVFPEEKDQKSLQVEFAELAAEIIQEMVQEAMENA